MDDMYVDRIGRKQATGKQEARDRSRAVADQQRRNTAMDKDEFLFENFFKKHKHLVASLGRKIYMALPPRGTLAPGHVLLVPVRHVTGCTELDEDEWAELQRFQQCLVAMWKSEGKDTVFMESVMGLRHQPHTVVHCVPLDGEEAEFAPM
jgi:diadenosine tetraphosphate (Ap4A) HIT family hydrolase